MPRAFKRLRIAASASAILVLLWCPAAGATSNDIQNWTTARVNHGLSKSWAVNFTARARFDNNISDIQDYSLLPYLSFTQNESVPFIDSLTLLAGYQRIKSYTGDDEHRSWQSGGHTVDRGNFRFNHRFRLDQRFIDNVGPVVVRGRYRISMTTQFFKTRWYSSLRNEVLFNLNDGNRGPSDGFESNRLRAGIGRLFGDRVRTDLGYEMQYVERRGHSETFRHVFFLELSFASGFDPKAVRSGIEAKVETDPVPAEPER